MKHSILLLLLTIVLTACNDKPTTDCTPSALSGASVEREGDDPTPTTCPDDSTTTPSEPTPTEPDPEPVPPTTGGGAVPNEAELFSSEVTFTNFSNSDEDKVQRALDLIRRVIRTEEFRTRVLNHKYNGVKGFASSTKTNAQIYQTFLDGAETLKPEKDHEMDLQLELYTNNSNNVVGYTYPNVLKIWMNTKYFNQYEPCEVARNLFHEWTHKLGYGHDSNVTSRRPYSVPYAVGSIMQDIACEL